MLLSLGLLAGASATAYAQSDSIAALPPGASAPAPTAVVPSGTYPGPDPGRGWGIKESQTQPVAPSPHYVGPKPGGSWGIQESHTRPVEPSPKYIGPAPN
jgi:hypothetical protein